MKRRKGSIKKTSSHTEKGRPKEQERQSGKREQSTRDTADKPQNRIHSRDLEGFRNFSLGI